MYNYRTPHSAAQRSLTKPTLTQYPAENGGNKNHADWEGQSSPMARILAKGNQINDKVSTNGEPKFLFFRWRTPKSSRAPSPSESRAHAPNIGAEAWGCCPKNRSRRHSSRPKWGTNNLHFGGNIPSLPQQASAKSEIGFRKCTPRTDPSPHSPQIIPVTYLQSSTMLRWVQSCDRVVATSQNVFSHLS
jgi:hypothetical protein